MKMITSRFKTKHQARLVARFGVAHLVHRHNGILELCGGTRENQVEVCEWISLFMHEGILRIDSLGGPPKQV